MKMIVFLAAGGSYSDFNLRVARSERKNRLRKME